jgi:WD40 repeat protein
VVLALVLAVAVGAGLSRTETTADPPKNEAVRTDRYGDPLPKGAVAWLGTLRFCQPNPMSVAFSPDGKVLASAGCDNRVRLWDPDTGKEVHVLEGHTGEVYCIAFSADGKLLASGGLDHDVRLWEVETGKERRRFKGHVYQVYWIALSPDGKTLASCSSEAMILWDTETGKQICSVDGEKKFMKEFLGGPVAFTPDGRQLAVSNRRARDIQLLDVADGKLVRSFVGHKADAITLAFSADGKTLFSGSGDNTLRVWDVASGKEERHIGDDKKYVQRLAAAPDGKTLTYGTTDGLVHIWDLAADKDLVKPWKANQYGVVSIAYSPDSRKVAVCSDAIAIHETATGKRLNPVAENESAVEQVEFAPDGKVLAVRHRDGNVVLWDTSRWRKEAAFRMQPDLMNSMAFSPDGKYLTAVESEQGVIRHRDPHTGKERLALPLQGNELTWLSHSADGELVAALLQERRRFLIFLDAESGKERARVEVTQESISNLRPSPDGRLVAATTQKYPVVLWDAKTQRLVRRFGEAVMSMFGWQPLAFSPDGRSIASAAGDLDPTTKEPRDVVLWETATGRERLRLSTGEGNVRFLAFAPGGRLLASARGEDIRLWDAWTGKQVGSFAGHRGSINSLTFAPEGGLLSSGGSDGTVLVWDVSGSLPADKKPAENLGGDELARCWNDLAGTDAARAYRAIDELGRRPEQVETLLKEKLEKIPGVNAERLARLVADLDADDFKVRQKASEELAALGRSAEGALTKALEGNPSAEVKRRVTDLLAKLEGAPESAEQSLLLRAVEALERVGTPGARRLLEKLAKEAPQSEVVREARASLARLGKRPG